MSDETPLVLAVYGAAGALGREILVALEGQGLSIDRMIPVGAARSAGDEIRWRGRPCRMVGPAEVVPGELDAAILAVPSAVAGAERARLMHAGVLTLDCSRSGRTELPTLWPSTNREVLETHKGGLAMAGALTSTLAPVAVALSTVGPIESLSVVALMTATASGLAGPELLSSQTIALLGSRIPERGALDEVLAFNVLAGVSGRAPDDLEALEAELPSLVPALAATRIDASQLQVPAFVGVLIDVLVRYVDESASEAAVLSAFEARPDLVVEDELLSLRDALERDEVLVSTPRATASGALRIQLAADPLHRVAEAVALTLELIARENLW